MRFWRFTEKARNCRDRSSGRFDLRDVGGAVRVRNQSGSVRVRDLSDDAVLAEHSVQTTYADIDIGWPRDRAVSFRLESTYGSVRLRDE
jgi:hypothetical protein